MASPLIAVVGYHLPSGRVTGWERGGFAVPEPYAFAVARAGGTPAILAPGSVPANDGNHLLHRFDGLLLVGGGDVEPARYGSQPDDALYGVDPHRDALEFELLRAADAIGLPTLAVCRGVQVMNVVFGGSLFQHLPDHEAFEAHGVPGREAAATHDVKVAEGSRLFEATRRPSLTCSSHHHQGIDRLGDGLAAVGWSGDGLVEAVERYEGWMLGVQWHPEATADADPSQQALFDALVARAGGWSRL